MGNIIVNTENITKKKGKLDWEASIGMLLYITYFKTTIVAKLVGVEKLTVSIMIGDKTYENIRKCDLSRGKIKYIMRSIIDLNTDEDFVLKQGDIIHSSSSDLKVVARCYSDDFTVRKYVVKCLKCGKEHTKIEHDLINRHLGCRICSNKKIDKDVNSVFALDKWCLKYFLNPEEAKYITSNSKKKVDYICSCCGNKIYGSVFKTVYKHKFVCEKCRDGQSYPNKFLYALLEELHIKYNREYSINGNNKRYDVYIPHLNLIIEAHGMQHYDRGFETYGGRSLIEEQENDRLKRELALNNGIKHYVVLDCRKSEMEWIKNSVMNSYLPNLLGFKENDVDWKTCDDNAISSYAKKAIDLWNSGIENVYDIAKIMGISDVTVATYIGYSDILRDRLNNNIHKCCELWNDGFCIGDIKQVTGFDTTTIKKYLINGEDMTNIKYSIEESKKRGRNKCSNLQKKRILCETIDMEFDCAEDMVAWFKENKNIDLNPSCIRGVCSGKRKTYKGYKIKDII